MAFSTVQGSGANDATTFVGTSGVDALAIANSEGNIYAGAQQSADTITLLNSGSALYTGLASAVTLKGGQGADTIQTTSAAATTFSSAFINGNTDADTISFGVAAADAFLAGTVHGGQGTDTINTGALTSSIVNGNKEADNITINRAANSSTVFGGQANDTVAVNAGVNNGLVRGDIGDDTITSNASAHTSATFNGGTGIDSINLALATAGSTGTVINGGQGDDILTGAIAATVINGDIGDDNMTGGAGTDTLNGGVGVDRMTGAAGADRIVYTGVDQTGTVATGAIDTIVDFTTTADRISGFGVAGSAAGEFTSVAGTTADTYAMALTRANAVFAAITTQSYYMTSYGITNVNVQGVLFTNIDNNATADGAINIATPGARTVAAGALLCVAGDILA